MSASSKKKLRKEQNAAQLTERQRKERVEAKKLKAASVIFVVIMVCVVVTALAVMVIKGVQNSGILEKNTVVATVGEHDINAIEANYYFTDLLSNTNSEWNSMYGDSTASFLGLMGLDTSLPLDEQYYDEGVTWADYFLESALNQAKADYAVYDAAIAAGFTLSEEEKTTLDNNMNNVELYAMIYGYTDVDDYLRSMYGPGSSLESYRAYSERSAIASAYYNAYSEGLNYEDAQIREYEKEKYNDYSSFTYVNYLIDCNQFLPEDAEPTAEDNAAAEASAKAAAESLLSATTVDELDAAIAALDINADAENAASTRVDNTLFPNISSVYRDWLAEDDRKENDIQVFANETTSGEETTITGYYVVMFLDSCDNTQPLGNVRHLLVKHEHVDGEEHSDDDMIALKAEADGYLQTWLEGDKTEESFIELVEQYSDDSSASTGGLFEDIGINSGYVAAFEAWAIDPSRKAGDAEVIETEFGYHVMYYVGGSELSCRDNMIITNMKAEDVDAWYNGIIGAAVLTVLDTSRVHMDRTLLGA